MAESTHIAEATNCFVHVGHVGNLNFEFMLGLGHFRILGSTRNFPSLLGPNPWYFYKWIIFHIPTILMCFAIFSRLKHQYTQHGKERGTAAGPLQFGFVESRSPRYLSSDVPFLPSDAEPIADLAAHVCQSGTSRRALSLQPGGIETCSVEGRFACDCLSPKSNPISDKTGVLFLSRPKEIQRVLLLMTVPHCHWCSANHWSRSHSFLFLHNLAVIFKPDNYKTYSMDAASHPFPFSFGVKVACFQMVNQNHLPETAPGYPE